MPKLLKLPAYNKRFCRPALYFFAYRRKDVKNLIFEDFFVANFSNYP
jgi:hypothetical protein